MTYLDYAHELTARAWTRDGTQWTIMPELARRRRQVLDVPQGPETIDGTIYLDDKRTVGQLRRDIAEEPNRIYMTSVTPEGMRVRNGVYPGLRKTRPAPYPIDDDSDFGAGTEDDDTDTGDGIAVMTSRLQVTGYLRRRTTAAATTPTSCVRSRRCRRTRPTGPPPSPA